MILPALFYIVWDIAFTSLEIWKFNDKYITGIMIYNLPLEEILFFLVIPYCCVFIYECIRVYFPQVKTNRRTKLFFSLLASILLVTGILFYDKAYTASTCIFTALCIGLILLFPGYSRHFNQGAFLVAYLIILIPFLVVNGFLTSLPVVMYNDSENLGMKIFTIPVEDIFYGMLLVMLNVMGYEKLKSEIGSLRKTGVNSNL